MAKFSRESEGALPWGEVRGDGEFPCLRIVVVEAVTDVRVVFDDDAVCVTEARRDGVFSCADIERGDA